LFTAIVAVGLPQLAVAKESPEIIVEGLRDRDKEVHEFVDALTPAPVGGQISRYERPVCPAATGLPQDQNQQVADRMRQVAREAQIRLAKVKCQPNVIVVVVDGKDAFIAALKKKYPVFFATPIGRDIVIPKGSESATAWHIEGLLDSNGNEASIQLEMTMKVVGGNGMVTFVTERRKNYRSEDPDGSRIKPMAQPHFISGLLIVERSALAGLTTTQLADYASMRLFGRTDPRRLSQSRVPSILTAIDTPMGSAVPLTLTNWDMAFLKSLYAMRSLRFATGQRAAIRQRFRQELRAIETRTQ
jgi:hypothetical protein